MPDFDITANYPNPFTNLTLNQSLDASATGVVNVLEAGGFDMSLMPQNAYLTINAANSTREVIRISARDSTAKTITIAARGVDGTTGQSHVATEVILCPPLGVYHRVALEAASGVHGVTGTIVGTTDTQALTNKTLGNTNTLSIKDTLFTLQDNSDATKLLAFELSGLTTATTRTLTVPDVSDTLVTLAATQTLTGKTLTSPSIASPTITTEWDFGAHSAGFTLTDNGNSGTSDTIDWRVSNYQKSTFTGNCTFTFTAPTKPGTLTLECIQDGTVRTITWPSTVKWQNGVAPTFTGTSGKSDICVFKWNGSVYMASFVNNFANA